MAPIDMKTPGNPIKVPEAEKPNTRPWYQVARDTVSGWFGGNTAKTTVAPTPAPATREQAVSDLSADYWLNPIDGPLKLTRENPRDPKSPWLIKICLEPDLPLTPELWVKDIAPLSDSQRRLFTEAAKEYEKSANIKINFVSNHESADISAYQGKPRIGGDFAGTQIPTTGNIYLNPAHNKDKEVGSLTYGTILHEMFHVIQGIGDIGDDKRYNITTSIMSYNHYTNNGAWLGGEQHLRDHDKAALRQNFGPPQFALNQAKPQHSEEATPMAQSKAYAEAAVIGKQLNASNVSHSNNPTALNPAGTPVVLNQSHKR